MLLSVLLTQNLKQLHKLQKEQKIARRKKGDRPEKNYNVSEV